MTSSFSISSSTDPLTEYSPFCSATNSALTIDSALSAYVGSSTARANRRPSVDRRKLRFARCHHELPCEALGVGR